MNGRAHDQEAADVDVGRSGLILVIGSPSKVSVFILRETSGV